MKVLRRGTMPDGTDIQIEDWNETYQFMPYGRTIAAYPISKYTLPGGFAPKAGERYRFSFDFSSNGEAMQVFDALVSGERTLGDYRQYLSESRYKPCV